ncbi:hypothetical protein [Bradyrhizobium sp. CCGB01]|uniref:hypothetical protein n=1 Tax=Bradyrhizobium sp. CCGB01 TaxID=2949634 RepID=UPI0020B333A8|nr:hypothetical protein [Bradyrhizobium sp. CCGB01]MCP3410325.1 hypothetical protein [Bradyrhizobium sp. CCGB01]
MLVRITVALVISHVSSMTCRTPTRASRFVEVVTLTDVEDVPGEIGAQERCQRRDHHVVRDWPARVATPLHQQLRNQLRKAADDSAADFV